MRSDSELFSGPILWEGDHADICSHAVSISDTLLTSTPEETANDNVLGNMQLLTITQNDVVRKGGHNSAKGKRQAEGEG